MNVEDTITKEAVKYAHSFLRNDSQDGLRKYNCFKKLAWMYSQRSVSGRKPNILHFTALNMSCEDTISVLVLQDVSNSNICTVNRVSFIPVGVIGEHQQRWTEVKDDCSWSSAWRTEFYGLLDWIQLRTCLFTSIHDHAGQGLRANLLS